MRFQLTCDLHPKEVFGEEVTLPNAGVERFFVHHAIVPSAHEDREDRESWAKFAVSHVETGMRVASGETIDEAIANAVAKTGAMDASTIQQAVAKGHERLKQQKAALA